MSLQTEEKLLPNVNQGLWKSIPSLGMKLTNTTKILETPTNAIYIRK